MIPSSSPILPAREGSPFREVPSLDREKTIAFLPNRHYKLPETLYEEILSVLRRFAESGKDTLLLGREEGAEALFADAFDALKKDFPQLRRFRVVKYPEEHPTAPNTTIATSATSATTTPDTTNGTTATSATNATSAPNAADAPNAAGTMASAGAVASIAVKDGRQMAYYGLDAKTLTVGGFLMRVSSAVICYLSPADYGRSALMKYAGTGSGLAVVNLFQPALKSAAEKELYRLLSSSESSPQELAARLADWAPRVPSFLDQIAGEYRTVIEVFGRQYADSPEKLGEVSRRLLASLLYYAYCRGLKDAEL